MKKANYNLSIKEDTHATNKSYHTNYSLIIKKHIHLLLFNDKQFCNKVTELVVKKLFHLCIHVEAPLNRLNINTNTALRNYLYSHDTISTNSAQSIASDRKSVVNFESNCFECMYTHKNEIYFLVENSISLKYAKIKKKQFTT